VTEPPGGLIQAPLLPARQSLISYEDHLNQNAEWAMSEGSKFFKGRSQVQAALAKITTKLRELDIDYVVVGGMALFQHGCRRFTEYIELLVSRESLAQIHLRLIGVGYLPLFEGSKNLRDSELAVKIEFIRTGDFPGNNRPMPVAFPMPVSVSTEWDDVRNINLPKLIEWKVASGMTNPECFRDLADVLELIKVRNLPLRMGDELNPYVQVAFNRLWHDAHPFLNQV
jgi:hypothetical protein